METAPTLTPLGARCDSALGSYALPKTLLRIQVMGSSRDPKTAETALTLVEEITVPDLSRSYCLDHLTSAFAKDDVKVFRGDPAETAPTLRSSRTSTQLLTFISSNTIDYTADIARKIIRAIFIGLSGKPDFAPVARAARANKTAAEITHVLADHTFDPFDVKEVMTINEQLKPLGFCVFLALTRSDTVLRDGPAFCANPPRFKVSRTRVSDAYAAYERAVEMPTRVPGILYRPRQPYQLLIFGSEGPRGTGQWKLVQTVQARLENFSPVISVGVERAVFSARRTALLFDRGTLTGMCVSKKSELLAAVEIPLEVVRSVVALPTQILMVRIDEATEDKNLILAETALINLQRQYIEFLVDPSKSKPADGQAKVANPALPPPTAAVFDPPFELDETKRAAQAFTDFADICARRSTTSKPAPAGGAGDKS